MRLNLALIRRRLHRLRVGRWVDLRSLASEAMILHPEETGKLPAAIYLPGALEKITAISPFRSREREWQLIEGAVSTFVPSLAHRIDNVDIVSSCLYCGPAMEHTGYGEERLLVRNLGPRLEIDRANLVVTWNGCYFFGPYIADEFLLEMLAENPAENISMPTRSYEHEHGYRELLGLAHPPVVTHARVRKLTVYAEPLQNASKAERWRILRARLRNGSIQKSDRPGVYLKRGDTGERRLIDNEEEIEKLLRDLGFDVVEPARLTAEQIVQRTLDAKIVVSVEGSHLSHVIYTIAEGGAFLIFEPPDRFALPYKEFADCLGIRFSFLVGDKTEDGFSIPADDLRRMLDLLS